MTRWQFSIRALMLVTAVVAAVVAFVANYPVVAIVIVGCAAWMFVESGLIVDAVIAFSEPSGYARHPFIASIVGIVGGIVSAAISVFFVWMAFIVDPADILMLGPLLAAMLFGALSLYSFRVIWLAFKGPDESSAQTREKNDSVVD